MNYLYESNNLEINIVDMIYNFYNYYCLLLLQTNKLIFFFFRVL